MKSNIHEYKKINFKMVSKNNFLLLLITFTLLGIGSCTNNTTQDDPVLQLPPETQYGANTFGCYINSKLLIPRDGTGTVGSSDDGMSYLGGYPNNTDFYEIDVRDYKSNRTASILIHLKAVHINGIGNYVINSSNGFSSIDGLDHNYIHCRVFDESTNSYQYYRSFDNSGIVTVKKYDYLSGILSGTFSCSVRNSVYPNNEINISLGRFDINGYTLPDKVFP
jgi:hypothetical protein